MMDVVGVVRAGRDRVGVARYRVGVGWILGAASPDEMLDMIDMSYEPATTAVVVHVAPGGDVVVDHLRRLGFAVDVVNGACPSGDRRAAEEVWGVDRRLSELALAAFELIRHRVTGNPGRACS